jgi:hypothetical protein
MQIIQTLREVLIPSQGNNIPVTTGVIRIIIRGIVMVIPGIIIPMLAAPMAIITTEAVGIAIHNVSIPVEATVAANNVAIMAAASNADIAVVAAKEVTVAAVGAQVAAMAAEAADHPVVVAEEAIPAVAVVADTQVAADTDNN